MTVSSRPISTPSPVALLLAGRRSSDVPRTSAQDITSSTGASTAADGGVGDGSELYGSSYTNRRTREADILHDIVRQTRQNFIDVATAAASTLTPTTTATASTHTAAAGSRYGGGERGEEEREEKSRMYTANLNKPPHSSSDRKEAAGTSTHLPSSLLTSSLLAAPPVVASLLSLPLPPALTSNTSAGTALADLLYAAALHAGERQWLLTQSQLVSGAVAETHIASPSKLVLAFEELQLPAHIN